MTATVTYAETTLLSLYDHWVAIAYDNHDSKIEDAMHCAITIFVI